MHNFTLHPALRADCHVLGQWQDLWVLLHKDAQVRWFILVPETTVTEWHDVPESLRARLTDASLSLGRMLTADLGCHKVNIAAIGNLVPQFHFHVIGRWETDPYWPGVVWGRVTPGAVYGEGEVAEIRARVMASLPVASGGRLPACNGLR